MIYLNNMSLSKNPANPKIEKKEGEKLREWQRRAPDGFLNSYVRPQLDKIRDSIILCLFERSRLKKNTVIYIPGAGPPVPEQIHSAIDGKIIDTSGLSFMEFLLLGTEIVHATAGRYKNPEEYPYFKNVIPDSMVPRQERELLYHTKAARNMTGGIKQMYVEAIQNGTICQDGDDDEYGSSSEWDIKCLQELSKRIHYGFVVAETKFLQNPGTYRQLAESKNVRGIIKELRNKKRERDVLKAVEDSGKKYGVNPKFVKRLFKNQIIPLTTNIEVDYFLRRAKNHLD